MTMPFYASPEQIMKDRADYARRNIARGRPVVALAYDGGVAFVTENPSRALHKISEIYDRIAFAATGRYNEFENLRVAGVRYADLRGYSYDRTDVTARGLANAYAQNLGAVFTTEQKPLEVELVVAEVGTTAETDQIYRLTYDGSVADERGFVAIGGQADQIMSGLQEQWREDLTLSEALTLAVAQLTRDPSGGPPRTLGTNQIEVAILDRLRPRRAFRRLAGPLLERLLTPGDPTTDVPHTDDGRPGLHDTLTEVEPPAGDGPQAPDTTPDTTPGTGPGGDTARSPDDHEPGDHDLGGEG
jgi:proteasome alpha subunit